MSCDRLAPTIHLRRDRRFSVCKLRIRDFEAQGDRSVLKISRLVNCPGCLRRVRGLLR